MIVYLNDVEVGGGTVWPCMTYVNTTKLPTELRTRFKQVSYHCQQAFAAGGRWYDSNEVVTLENKSKHKPSPALKQHLDEVVHRLHSFVITPFINLYHITGCVA
jgi:hypothetical protein